MNSFFDLIRGIPTPFNMVVLIVLFSVLAGVLTTIIKQVRKYLALRYELDFKRELLDRGLSIEEIERLASVKSSTLSERDE